MMPTVQPRAVARTAKTTLEAELEEARSAMTRSGVSKAYWRSRRVLWVEQLEVVTVFSVFWWHACPP